MLRYAALNHELKSVMRGVYDSGSRVILDYAKENCKLRDANHIADVNIQMISAMPPDSMYALKYTSFGSRESKFKADGFMRKVIGHAVKRRVKVCVDAEDVVYPKLSYDLLTEFNQTEPNVFKTYQMYRRDALLELEADLLHSDKYRIQHGAKLVRGAYVRKQDRLFDTKREVDVAYRRALEMTLSAGPHVHTLVATHNSDDIAYARTAPRDRYEIAQLLGMAHDFPDYVYVPYGSLVELTPYLIRRLIERMKWS